MHIGQRIRQARLEAGLSQRQLCGDVITRNMLSQIENGSARPSMSTLQYLADRLGKRISYFLEEDAPSPNLACMRSARAAYAQGDSGLALEQLAQFYQPDPDLEWEYRLLLGLCCILRAEQTGDPQYLDTAGQALRDTPYATAALDRSRLLLLAQLAPERSPELAALLPADDRELLLRARAALSAQLPQRSAQLLDAAEDQNDPAWLILRGDAAFACGQYAQAAQWYQQAEAHSPSSVWPKLEQCYLRLEDFRMAYHYACKQR